MNAYAWFNMSFVSCKQFVQSMIQKFKACKIFYCFKKSILFSPRLHLSKIQKNSNIKKYFMI